MRLSSSFFNFLNTSNIPSLPFYDTTWNGTKILVWFEYHTSSSRKTYQKSIWKVKFNKKNQKIEFDQLKGFKKLLWKVWLAEWCQTKIGSVCKSGKCM